MEDHMIFQQVKVARHVTLSQFEGLTEEMADQIPEGYNNSIRWHLGHILNTQNRLMFMLSDTPTDLPETYNEWFGNGTKPADWESQPPTLEELKSLLSQQTEQIIENFSGKLQEQPVHNFNPGGKLEFSTMEELLSFSLFHEGLHIGEIKGLKKAMEG